MKITVVENVEYSVSTICDQLRKKWYSVACYNEYENFQNSYNFESDVYIIDVSLSMEQWYSLIKWLKRQDVYASIIVLFWPLDTWELIKWWSLWVDDCIEKPYVKEELFLRINNLVRRKYNCNYYEIVIGNNIKFLPLSRIFFKNEKLIHLTNRETQLAEFFIFNIWKLISKSQVINSVWWEYEVSKISENNLNVVISNVRKKLWKSFNLKTFINKWYILKK